MTSKTIDIGLDEIFNLAKAALINHGANEENANAVATTVTNAERDGSISHGLFRIPGYIKALQSKKVDGSAKPTITEVTPVILKCDAKNGFAPLAHQYGIKKLIKAAQKFGIAGLSIQRCHHFAALWPEVEAISEHGLVGLTSVSYMPGVAPSGGATALFGTNPIAFSWPCPGKNPIVFDMATASMAKGEIQIAARDGHSVPLGTGLSSLGELTTDASEIDKGVLLPFGGHKGSVIALMVELLSGPLVGETFSYETKERDNGDGGPAQGGQFILAMSPEIISGKDTSAQTEEFIKKYNDIEGTRLPGLRRHENRKNIGPRAVNSELINTIKKLA
ncbi:Ldh family oxidoreductase [Candidatus Thioglobus sp.]|nr:Ldh family oxidoreductase [Candidatus Thioglobus sp.]